MVKVQEHLNKIEQTKLALKTATGYRRNDLIKYLKRLKREYAEYLRYSQQTR